MNYDNIAIPSHARASTLHKKTGALLRRLEVDPSRVHVFVDEEEWFEYEEVVEALGFQLRVGRRGLPGQRAAIAGHYGPGTRLICMDDDVQDIMMLGYGHELRAGAARGAKPTPKLRSATPDDFEHLCGAGFTMAQEAGTPLWGIYPTANAMFQHPGKVRKDLRLIAGPFWGCLLDPRWDNVWNVEYADKEDHERTLQVYQRFGAVVRLDWASIKTTYYTGAGGIDTRDQGTTEKAVEALKERWPDWVKPGRTKSYGYAEVVLSDRTSST